MKILKKGGEEETKSMPHAPVVRFTYLKPGSKYYMFLMKLFFQIKKFRYSDVLI